MSIYITIIQANLSKKPKHNICFMIESQESVLKSKVVETSLNPVWEDSFICSETQKQLLINLVEDDQEAFSIQMKKYLFGQALIDFQKLYIKSQPRKHLLYNLDLFKGDKCVGNVQIGVYYNDAQTYIGQIEFYDMKKLRLEMKKQKKQFVTKISTDSNISARKYHEDILLKKQKQCIPFYKGPCRTKNLFSCMDQTLAQESFHFVEKKYS